MSIVEDFSSKYTEIETFIKNKNLCANNDKAAAYICTTRDRESMRKFLKTNRNNP